MKKANTQVLEFRRVLDNRAHKALVSKDRVTLINKSTKDEIDLLVSSDAQRECLLDVIFNRD